MHVRRNAIRTILAGVVLLLTVMAHGGSAGAVGSQVGLGTATSYAILAGSTVTNTGPTVVTGDLGVHPGSAVTGFLPGGPGVVVGTIRTAPSPEALQAKSDLVTAYNDAAGRATTRTITADLVGEVLVSGVYTRTVGDMSLTGVLTLDGEGDPNAVFVFQAASTLTTGSASSVVFTRGAQACNVFWQVGSSATLGTNSDFSGTILAQTSITATTGATVSGRLLARDGAVTLDDNTITRPTCAAAVVTTTTSTTSTSTTSTTAAATTTTSTTAAPTTTSTTSTTVRRPTTTTTSTTSTTAAPAVTTTSTTPDVTATPVAPTTPPAGLVEPGVTATGSGPSVADASTGIIGSLVPASAADSSVGVSAAPGGTLPRTGSPLLAFAIGGVVAIALGAGLLRLSRRPVYLPLHTRTGG